MEIEKEKILDWCNEHLITTWREAKASKKYAIPVMFDVRYLCHLNSLTMHMDFVYSGTIRV